MSLSPSSTLNLALHASQVAEVYILQISTIAEALQSDQKLQLLGHKLFKGFIGSRQWKQIRLVDWLQHTPYRSGRKPDYPRQQYQ
jgi:hypothetical protein